MTRGNKKLPLHFLHIGKTGGTNIKDTLKNNLVTNHFEIVLHNHNIKLYDVPVGNKFFFFLRDPVDRFTSSFYSRQREGRPRYYYPWSQGEKLSFERFSTPNHLAESLSSADEAEMESAITAMKSIGHINTSFYDWFKNDEYFKERFNDVFFIGFQETLGPDFTLLKVKLGLPDGLQLFEDDIKAHRNPQNVDKHLSLKAVRNLKEWYARDIAFYNGLKNRSQQ